MQKLPVSKLEIDDLRLFCKMAEDLLKRSPAITTRDTLVNIETALENEERYGIVNKLLAAISEIIRARMIYGEIPIENSFIMLLDIASGNLKLGDSESRIPHLVTTPESSSRPRLKIVASA